MKYLLQILFSTILISQISFAMPIIAAAGRLSTAQKVGELAKISSSALDFIKNISATIDTIKDTSGYNSETEKRLKNIERELNGLKTSQQNLEMEISKIKQQSTSTENNSNLNSNYGVVTNTIFSGMSVIQNLQDELYEAYVNGDEREAFRLFERLAKQGDTVGKFYFGLMYKNGKGYTAKNLRQACILFGESSQQGYVPAKEHLDWDCFSH